MKILNVSDIHLTANRPIARKDEDWIGAQQEIINWIVDLSIEKKADVILDNGDTFDTSVQHFSVINIIPKALEGKSMPWVSMLGNHSLQYHQRENYMKSSMSTLGLCRNIEVLDCTDEFESDFHGIQMIHRLVCEGENDVFKSYETAESIMKDYPHSNLILCGDNHHSYMREENGRYLFNVGNAIRHSASMIESTPRCVFLDYDEENDKLLDYEWIDIPDKGEMVSNEHLIKIQEKEEHKMDFLEKIKDQEKITLDFWDNVDKYLGENEINKETEDVLLQVRDNCG